MFLAIHSLDRQYETALSRITPPLPLAAAPCPRAQPIRRSEDLLPTPATGWTPRDVYDYAKARAEALRAELGTQDSEACA